MKRILPPTCELKSAVKAAILNTENEVQVLRSKVETLQNTVEDIADLLKKTGIGNVIK
jgi:hypothetical protein